MLLNGLEFYSSVYIVFPHKFSKPISRHIVRKSSAIQQWSQEQSRQITSKPLISHFRQHSVWSKKNVHTHSYRFQRHLNSDTWRSSSGDFSPTIQGCRLLFSTHFFLFLQFFAAHFFLLASPTMPYRCAHSSCVNVVTDPERGLLFRREHVLGLCNGKLIVPRGREWCDVSSTSPRHSFFYEGWYSFFLSRDKLRQDKRTQTNIFILYLPSSSSFNIFISSHFFLIVIQTFFRKLRETANYATHIGKSLRKDCRIIETANTSSSIYSIFCFSSFHSCWCASWWSNDHW